MDHIFLGCWGDIPLPASPAKPGCLVCSLTPSQIQTLGKQSAAEEKGPAASGNTRGEDHRFNKISLSHYSAFLETIYLCVKVRSEVSSITSLMNNNMHD